MAGHKFGFFEDTFEQVLELGKSTAKQTTQAVKSIVDPTKLAESVMGVDKSGNDKGMEQIEKGTSKKQNHTKLDFSKLQKKYQDQDKTKTDMLRQRLFQMVKRGEEKAQTENKQEVMEKKRTEAYQDIEKKRREEERKRQEESSVAPQGKVRKSIFSAKKAAKREQTEVKPSSGKQ